LDAFSELHDKTLISLSHSHIWYIYMYNYIQETRFDWVELTTCNTNTYDANLLAKLFQQIINSQVWSGIIKTYKADCDNLTLTWQKYIFSTNGVDPMSLGILCFSFSLLTLSFFLKLHASR
jgi:hypothetical protein